MSDFIWPSEVGDSKRLDEQDRAIVLATQTGLPLTTDPWGAGGELVGMNGSEVLSPPHSCSA